MTFSVRYAKSIYERQVKKLPASARAELDAHVRSLREHPLPGDRSAVFRVRTRDAVSPLYAARTRRFMVYHTLEDDCVVVVSVLPIPQLKP